MECRTHIVECLRNNGINPSTASSTLHGNSPSSDEGINYTTDKYFFTEDIPNQWWSIDFKNYVAISRYSIKTKSSCNYVNNWTISISNDNKNFKKIDSQGTFYPGDTVYYLKRLYVTRFLRVDGNSPLCSTNYLGFLYITFFGKTNCKSEIYTAGDNNIVTQALFLIIMNILLIST